MALFIGSDELTGGATFTYNGVQVKQLDVKATSSSTPVTVWRSSYSVRIILNSAATVDITIEVDGVNETITAGNTFDKTYSYEASGSLTYAITANGKTVSEGTISGSDKTISLSQSTEEFVLSGTYANYTWAVGSSVNGSASFSIQDCVSSTYEVSVSVFSTVNPTNEYSSMWQTPYISGTYTQKGTIKTAFSGSKNSNEAVLSSPYQTVQLTLVTPAGNTTDNFTLYAAGGLGFTEPWSRTINAATITATLS